MIGRRRVPTSVDALFELVRPKWVCARSAACVVNHVPMDDGATFSAGLAVALRDAGLSSPVVSSARVASCVLALFQLVGVTPAAAAVALRCAPEMLAEQKLLQPSVVVQALLRLKDRGGAGHNVPTAVLRNPKLLLLDD